ncbi:MAG: hypothetical protein FWE17_01955 [Alphaproteobacteria bacterium]|nr:hypothetical protein [Alphaproteobacteria bacterium]MCL2758243.1 hypothetical protein [Alphaproteobacteria bacterium]
MSQTFNKCIARMKGEFVQGLIDNNMLLIAPDPKKLQTKETSGPADENFWFTLKSGAKSPLFWSIQTIQDNPCLWYLAVSLLVNRIQELGLEFDKVAGVPEGMTATAAVVGYEFGKGVLTIRKQEKSHGQGGMIVGNLKPEDRVLVLEDVATTGLSILSEAALKLQKLSGAKNVKDAVVLLDRQQGATENLAAGWHITADKDSGHAVVMNNDGPHPVRLHSVLTQSEAIKYWNPTTPHHKAMKPIIEKYLAQNTK